MEGYHQDISLEDGILRFRLSGRFPNELLSGGQNLFQPLADACAGQNCDKALIDARDLEVDFSTIAIFQAGKDVAQISSMGLRIAFVAREDMLDPFFDDVSFNRGANISMFTDIDAAKAWLLK